MLNTALRFMSECDRVGLKYRDSRDLDNGESIVVCGVNGKNNARYSVLLVFGKEGRDLSLRVPDLLSFSEERQGELQAEANALNGTYRWLKFYTKDNRVCAQCDAVISEETSGSIGVELLVRTMRIIDEIYPRFMKVLWS